MFEVKVGRFEINLKISYYYSNKKNIGIYLNSIRIFDYTYYICEKSVGKNVFVRISKKKKNMTNKIYVIEAEMT